ncbi:MAG TPA: UrcA family protein [Steroidobacteraceae bacterium]|nr:UrcA family protein [Steroidobacteraceae bacterium]
MARLPLAIFAAGLGGLLLTSASFAATTPSAPTVRVSYSDLDLTKDAGVERLYARLQNAAARVCRSLESRDLAIGRAHQQCVSTALDRAVEDVHSSRLTARHKGAAAGQQYARAS